jgi:hypothetical protein
MVNLVLPVIDILTKTPLGRTAIELQMATLDLY